MLDIQMVSIVNTAKEKNRPSVQSERERLLGKKFHGDSQKCIVLRFEHNVGDSLEDLRQVCKTERKIKELVQVVFEGTKTENMMGEGEFKWKLSMFLMQVKQLNLESLKRVFDPQKGGSKDDIWNMFAEELDPSRLCQDLKQEGLLDEIDEAEMLGKKTRKHRMLFLLDKLIAMPSKGYDVLLSHCMKYNTYVIQKLEENEIGMSIGNYMNTFLAEGQNSSDLEVLLRATAVVKIKKKEQAACRKTETIEQTTYRGSETEEYEITCSHMQDPVYYFDDVLKNSVTTPQKDLFMMLQCPWDEEEKWSSNKTENVMKDIVIMGLKPELEPTEMKAITTGAQMEGIDGRCAGSDSRDCNYTSKSLSKYMESNKDQESPEKDTEISGNSGDEGCGAQRPTGSLPTEHGSPKSDKSQKRKHETWSPALERSLYLLKGETNMANYESLKVFQMPLCLIETQSDGKLKAHQNVLDQISQIDHLLNIVCIAGPYRTGKSYLLTRLAGRNKGFALGNTIEAQTKGIWVWCRPHPIKKDQVLLLMDTEGLGDISKGDKNNDNQILSLGILLSSTLVYNILGKFFNEYLQTLSFVTEVSKNITFSDKMSIEESSSNFDRVFPTFILTLRDFCLEVEFEGKQITPDEYLEKVCLKVQPDTSQKNRDNNRTRLCLMEYFKTRKCFTFDRPGGRKVLRNLEDLQDEDLQQEFIQETKLFIDYVYNKCPPKQMNNGHPVNGRRFVILAEQYVGAIRNGKVPNVVDALASMVNLENNRAIKETVRIYLSGMSKLQYPTPDSSTLSNAHKRCFDGALDYFGRNSMYDEKGHYYNLVMSQLTKEYEHIRVRDEEKSKNKSHQALEGLDVVIRQKVTDGCYNCRGGYKLYLKDMKTLETDYGALTGLGCKKTDMLNKYHSDTASRRQIIMQADETLTNKEKELEVEKQKTAEAERRQEAEKRLREEQKRLHEEECVRNNEAYEQLKQKYEKELQNEWDHLMKVLEQRQKEMERLEKEGLLKEAERVKSAMEKASKELDEYENAGFFATIGRAGMILGKSVDKTLSNMWGFLTGKK